ncbi:MAG: molybdenum cofactor biosynthesis protein MoaE [Pseudomonadota bacterium]
MRVSLQSEPFDPGTELTAFSTATQGVGAIVSFSGIVRDTDGTLEAMEIEHYPGMTERALQSHAQKAVQKFGLSGVLIIHRYGRLTPGEPIMMVATSAPHRQAAFEGADFLMDFLKSRAPFWKKEHRADGADWVDAKTTDEAALDRWT